jgi:hypothetical protein
MGGNTTLTLKHISCGLMVFGLLQLPLDQVWSQTGKLDQGQPGDQIISATPGGKAQKVKAWPEEQAILLAARSYVRKNAAPEAKFKLHLTKKSGKWALVEVIPVRPFMTDEAMLVLEKTDRGWIGRTLGTDLSDWQKKQPELFR